MSGRFSPGGLSLLLVAMAALGGCALGPDFHHPDAPPAASYDTDPAQPATVATSGPGGAAQQFVAGQDIPAQWWTLFHCQALDQLIQQALVNSPTVQAAQAALRQSRQTMVGEEGSVLYPTVSAQAGVNRERISGIQLGQPGGGEDLSLYNASVNVSYNISAFGAGARRELESLQAQIDYQSFQLRAADLALSANLTTAAIQEASLKAQLDATQSIITDLQKQLDVAKNQLDIGAISRSALLAQQTQLAQTIATLPPLQQALDKARHQLTLLAGKLPGDPSVPEFSLSDFTLPEQLPVSLPSQLVRQRPDILAADAQLHAASANVGVATAAQYPQISLSASYGGEALSAGKVLNAGNTVWSLGADVLQPIFNGGALRAQKRAAIAAYDQANAQYRETVLLAFANVADSLRALDTDARSLQAQTDAAGSSKDALDISRQQLQSGSISYLTLLDAERQYQQTSVALAQAQASRYADTAALFQAMGGGWWNEGKAAR